MSILYIVSTPIGNLEDLTYRAVRILKEVDVIACEDTRTSGMLLQHYGIKDKRLISCRARNEKVSAEGVIKLLKEGLSVAYISDAGTPSISDPGSFLVQRVREEGLMIHPIPGASALGALISVAGSFKNFIFEGFLPQKGIKRAKRIQELYNRHESFMLYESPYRVIKLLEECVSVDPKMRILVGREMTKFYEEYQVQTAEDLLKDYQSRPSIKGEFAFFIYAKEGKKNKYLSQEEDDAREEEEDDFMEESGECISKLEEDLIVKFE